MAAVAVGFSPATNPGLVTGTGSATPQAEGGAEGGLFAALLALIGQQMPEAAAAGPATVQPAVAPVTLTVPPEVTLPADTAETDTTTQLASVAAAQTPKGKSLLKDLGDALIALNDALDAGEPVDPALEKKLDETLDAAVAYFGIVQPPPQPTIDPTISALASGEGILPSIPETAPPTVGPTPPAAPVDTAPVEDADSAAAIAPTDQPVESTASFEPAAIPAPAAGDATADAIIKAIPGGETVAKTIEAIADLFAAITAPAATTETEAPTEANTATAETADEPEVDAPAPHPELNRLAQLVEKLADKVAPAAPELAKKLDALATGLEAAAGTDTADTTDATPATEDADVTRIIDALSTPKPAATKPAEQQAFTAPALNLPEAIAPKDKTADASAQPVAADLDVADSDTLDPAPVDVKKPALTAHVAAEAKPSAGSDPVPAAQATPTAPTDTSAASSAAATAPNSAQPAAPIARTIHAAYQAAVQQLNLPQVAFEVVRQFDAGNSRFQIRLDPADLGRIDVRLDVDKAGTINARMTVERPETLDLMQRDQRSLQQALQQAGLDTSRTNLEFSLRQNPFAGQGGMADGRGQQQSPSGGTGGALASDEPTVDAVTTLYRGTASASGVNLFV